MADDDKPIMVETPLLDKEGIFYDPRSGRFYEKSIEEVCRDEFCTIDEKTGEPIILTLAEKERIFIDAMQSYYFSGKQILADDDFDKLKEDLQWEGSDYGTLNRDETKFLGAMDAYLKGQPIMSDEEFDALKNSLKEAGSLFAVNTEPTCYIDTGVCTVTFVPDRSRMFQLYLPAAFIATNIWLGVIFEIIEPIRAFNPLLLLFLGTPYIYFAAKFGTEKVWLTDPFIATGPCPSCSAPQRVFFGDVLGVEGNKERATMQCKNCKANLTIERASLKVSTDLKV
eukprot:CAMPEP_0113939884 /NCGR_PEP_ID=MMETSP1339-20121228/6112_1 /TAXON_ID=94617 /ORGANISM="Fibrocapsa japonica" /LENGTH=282 /DNA_ID=CAMNT_0000943519 /DNA_START=233 /DNA_END=1081 /DNA_ORIENTATION=- /assembly_acc=CAM_ASM_000762